MNGRSDSPSEARELNGPRPLRPLEGIKPEIRGLEVEIEGIHEEVLA